MRASFFVSQDSAFELHGADIMSLTEQMKNLVADLQSTQADRTATVIRFKTETAQTLKQDADDLREMSKRLRADLASNLKKRSEQVQALREHARGELRETRVRLNQMFEQNKEERKRHMTDLMQAFHTTRSAVVVDIQGAAGAWHHIHASKAAPKASAKPSPVAKPSHVAEPSTYTPPSPAVESSPEAEHEHHGSHKRHHKSKRHGHDQE